MNKEFVEDGGCFGWYSKLEESNLVLSFKGDFNHELVKAILILTHQEQAGSPQKRPATSRIFGIIVECLQNICKHGASLKEGSSLKPGIILIGRKEGEYRIGVGNIIRNEEISKLSNEIDTLNSMDEEGLRNRQTEILKHSSLTDDGNAGIGLIYMSRKTEGKMLYDFKSINAEYSFFSMELKVIE